MKKNKKSRICSRVLSYLAQAKFYDGYGKKESAHVFLERARKLVEEIGGKEVKVVYFLDEFHVSFSLFRDEGQYGRNRFYLVDVSHGFRNARCEGNRAELNRIIRERERVQDYTLKRQYKAYQDFMSCYENLLITYLQNLDYNAFLQLSSVECIPYDVKVNLWNNFQNCLWDIVNEGVAHRKVEL